MRDDASYRRGRCLPKTCSLCCSSYNGNTRSNEEPNGMHSSEQWNHQREILLLIGLMQEALNYTCVAPTFKNPRDQLGMTNLLLQAFPTCWQDTMDVYQKVTERPFGYMVLDLHPGSDDRSHLLGHEGYSRWHWRKREDV